MEFLVEDSLSHLDDSNCPTSPFHSAQQQVLTEEDGSNFDDGFALDKGAGRSAVHYHDPNEFDPRTLFERSVLKQSLSPEAQDQGSQHERQQDRTEDST